MKLSSRSMRTEVTIQASGSSGEGSTSGHLLWIPLLYFLWTRLDAIPANDAFGIWTRALMALNALSLVIDGIDVARYVAGDRAETM